MRTKLSILICSLSVFIFYNCSKTGVSQDHPKFIINGPQEVYSTITFFSNTTDSPVNWIFSDGTTVTGKIWNKQFYKPGQYTVSMISGRDSSSPVTAYLNITSGLERISGNRNWYHGREYRHDSSQYSNFALNDTSFKITVVDDTTISIGAMKLHGQNFDFLNYTNIYNKVEIALFHTNDSFIFSYDYRSGDSIHSYELQYLNFK